MLESLKALIFNGRGWAEVADFRLSPDALPWLMLFALVYVLGLAVYIRRVPPKIS